MKATLLHERVAGAFTGLVVGDALGRPLAGLSPAALSSADVPPSHRKARETPERGDRKHHPSSHGAVTTWTLAILDALLYRREHESLGDDLALRLRVLATPCRGAALRGTARSLAGALRQVAASLERDEDPRLCGIDDVRADVLCAALPLAFALGDKDEEVARALVSVVALTHRHVRVSSSCGLWLGGLRTLLRDPKAPLVDVLAGAQAFAELALDAYRDERAGVFVGARAEAEGALALARAAAHDVEDPRELLAPPGYDGRDAPERLALAALVGARLPAGAVVDLVHDRLEQGGDVDVTLPLLLASSGLAQGVDRLPLVLVQTTNTATWAAARAAALFGDRPPPLAPLIDEELRISQRAEANDDTMSPGAAASDGRRYTTTAEDRREQLKLL